MKLTKNENERCFTITGIADAHGIEQCFWSNSTEDYKDLGANDKQSMMFMSIRANANRHRHASFFRVNNVPDREKVILDQLLTDHKPQIALVYLKGVATECGGVQILKEHASSWDMIPNSVLDPYWNGDKKDLISTKLIK